MSFESPTLRTRIRNGGLPMVAGQALEALRTRVRNASLGRKFRVNRILIRSQYFIAGLEHITIGERFDAGRGLWLEAVTRHRDQTFNPRIVIGEDVSVSFWCHISAAESVIIGNHVMTGSKVLIIDHNHGNYGPAIHDNPDTPPAARVLKSHPIVIGDNVWIGDGAVITPGSRIGSGCVIGANAVVTGQVPANSVAVGIPARVIKQFDLYSQQWVSVR
jgi:lipopolysaccharide O-acetyltransferase